MEIEALSPVVDFMFWFVVDSGFGSLAEVKYLWSTGDVAEAYLYRSFKAAMDESNTPPST